MRALTEDSGHAYPRQRSIAHIERGEAMEAGTKQRVTEGLWHNVDFLRRVIEEPGRLGAFAVVGGAPMVESRMSGVATIAVS